MTTTEHIYSMDGDADCPLSRYISTGPRPRDLWLEEELHEAWPEDMYEDWPVVRYIQIWDMRAIWRRRQQRIIKHGRCGRFDRRT